MHEINIIRFCDVCQMKNIFIIINAMKAKCGILFIDIIIFFSAVIHHLIEKNKLLIHTFT